MADDITNRSRIIAGIVDQAQAPIAPEIPQLEAGRAKRKKSSPRGAEGAKARRPNSSSFPDPAAADDPLPSPAGAAAASASSDPPALRVVSSSAQPESQSSQTGESEKAGDAGGGQGGGAGGGDAGEIDRRCAFYPQTDLGNVERFVARYGQLIKWCAAIGWLYWDGKRWSRKGADGFVTRAEHATVRAIQDEAKACDDIAKGNVPLLTHRKSKVVTLAAERAAKREAQERRKNKKKYETMGSSLRAWGRKSEQANRLSPISKRAKGVLEIQHDALDCDPWKINVMNGTLIVRRLGDVDDSEPLIVLRPHDPADMITKLSPATYDPAAVCLEWDKFIARVQPSADKRRTIMQWLGYSLTGDAEEQKLAIWHGGGRNGKGTTIETAAYVAGDYAESVPIETFLSTGAIKSGAQATPDLAKLPGARFLRTGEPDKGAKLNEALIKRVTGGDPIDARDLNKSLMTFFTQFKLTIACNHKPRIGGGDEGIWSRVIFVPWNEFIPLAERDLKLKAKLRAEANGILNRMLDGLRDYLEHGLVLDAETLAATAKYREDSDPIGRFMAECTLQEEGAKAQSSLLHEVYLAWAKCNDAPNYGQKSFSETVEARGYEKRKISGIFFMGVKLLKGVGDFVDQNGKPLHIKDGDTGGDIEIE